MKMRKIFLGFLSIISIFAIFLTVQSAQTNPTATITNIDFCQKIVTVNLLPTNGQRGPASGPHLHYEVRDGNRTAAALCIDRTVNPYSNTF